MEICTAFVAPPSICTCWYLPWVNLPHLFTLVAENGSPFVSPVPHPSGYRDWGYPKGPHVREMGKCFRTRPSQTSHRTTEGLGQQVLPCVGSRSGFQPWGPVGRCRQPTTGAKGAALRWLPSHPGVWSPQTRLSGLSAACVSFDLGQEHNSQGLLTPILDVLSLRAAFFPPFFFLSRFCKTLKGLSQL